MTSFGDSHFHLLTCAGLVSLVRESPQWAVYLLDDTHQGVELARAHTAEEALALATAPELLERQV